MFFLAALVVIVAAWILIAVLAVRRVGRVRRLRRAGGDIGTWSAGGIWFGDSGGSQHGHSGCGGGHSGHSGCGGGSSCGGGGGGCGGGSSS